MARTFRRRQSQHPIAELNITNLMDVAFVLLIIFMIASPLINQQEQAIAVNLPAESTRPQPPPDKEDRFQSISISQNGQYYWGNRPVAFNELPALLANEARQPNPAVIRIRADSNIPYQRIVSVMDEIKKHNLSRFTFDTQATD